MKNKTKNAIIFAVELSVYAVLFMLFALSHFFRISNKTANVIYIVFMLFSFGWLFSYEFFFKKYDNAVHYKMFGKHYVPTKNDKPKEKYKRQGIAGVLMLWAAYLLVLALAKFTGLMTWRLFLMGACIMFMLNSIFVRKKCLLSVLFLHNKNDCCKNCGINCWDYSIFASALLFAPFMSIAAGVVNGVIITASVVMLVIWEYNFHKHPYRFYQETNKSLACKNCLKQCKYKD